MTNEIQNYSNANLVEQKKQISVADWLISKTPDQVLKSAEAAAKGKGVLMKVNYETHTKSSGGWYRIFKGVDFYGCHDKETQVALLDRFQRLMTPTTDEQIEILLAELSYVAKRRKGDEIDERATLAFFKRQLREYPADIAKDALDPRRWGFWPSLKEISEVCEPHMVARKAMLSKLEEMIASDGEKEAEECSGPKPDADERAAIAEKIMKQCGFRG